MPGYELRGTAGTLRRWPSQILAWRTTGVSNGPTEGLNALIKKIKPIAAGFRNFNHYLLRVLLHAGSCKLGPPRHLTPLKHGICRAGAVGSWEVKIRDPPVAGVRCPLVWGPDLAGGAARTSTSSLRGCGGLKTSSSGGCARSGRGEVALPESSPTIQVGGSEQVTLPYSNPIPYNSFSCYP